MNISVGDVLKFVTWLIATLILNNSLAQELDIQTRENIPSRSDKAFIDLDIQFGSPGKLLGASIKTKYPGFKLLSSCMGSFRKEGAADFAFGIFNPDIQQGIYISALQNGTLFGFVEIERFKAKFNDKGVLPKGIEVRCNSWTELLRIAKNYKEVPTETPAAGSTLQPISHFDSICTVPVNDVEEFTCYDYDLKKSRFVKIGGWFND